MPIPARWGREPCFGLRPHPASKLRYEKTLSNIQEVTARSGRVIAVAESPSAAPKDRPKVRRNVEAVIQQLNDLGVVVEEWPSR